MGKTIRRSANQYSSTNEFFKNEKLIKHKKSKREVGWSNHPDFKSEFTSEVLSLRPNVQVLNGSNSIDLGNND